MKYLIFGLMIPANDNEEADKILKHLEDIYMKEFDYKSKNDKYAFSGIKNIKDLEQFNKNLEEYFNKE